MKDERIVVGIRCTAQTSTIVRRRTCFETTFGVENYAA